MGLLSIGIACMTCLTHLWLEIVPEMRTGYIFTYAITHLKFLSNKSFWFRFTTFHTLEDYLATIQYCPPTPKKLPQVLTFVRMKCCKVKWLCFGHQALRRTSSGVWLLLLEAFEHINEKLSCILHTFNFSLLLLPTKCQVHLQYRTVGGTHQWGMKSWGC